jgi:hypothetical protein
VVELDRQGKSLHFLRIPSRERGRWPSSLTLGRGAMDADALLTNGA